MSMPGGTLPLGPPPFHAPPHPCPPRWGKTVVIVSHAREFLNAVCTDTVHLHARTLTQYKGDYDSFARTFKDRVKTSQAAAAAQEEKRAHMLEFINKFRYNANRAALVQSRIKALERMTGGHRVVFFGG